LSYSQSIFVKDIDMRKSVLTRFLTAGTILGLATASLFAQTDRWKDVKLEFSTGLSYEFSPLRSSYLHKYSPPFLSGAYVSTAQQTINLRGKPNWGVNGALTFFPLEHLGVQVQVEYGRPRLRGANSSYDVFLNYALASPAGSPPYPYVFEKSYGWPSTEGNLNELCLSLNAVIRLPLSNRICLNFSGGPTYFSVKAEGVGLAYSQYWMEDSYFMGETFQLKYRLGTFGKLGLNLGGEFNWIIFNTVGLVADVRFYGCPETRVQLEVLPNEMLDVPLSEVKTTMRLGSVQINPTFYRVNLGLKYLF
jgi:hypothetical protein